MLRYLEVPDVHFDPKWADITEQCINKVIETAREHAVDFIALPGDLFNRPLYATERDGFNRLRELVRRMVAVCPVVAVEGTPSHDGPGCYAPLEDIGLVLLRPGKVYGVWHRFPGVSALIGNVIGPVDVTDEQPDAILFGIPELTTKHVQSALSLPADAANAATLQAFSNYVSDFIAPMHQKYADIPAVALLHGVVSDSRQENETDKIKSRSSLMIHTDMLERAGVDRWTLGDIHTPWESQKISAGYAGFTGIDANPWGKTGFIPAMNVVTIMPRSEVLNAALQDGPPIAMKIDGGKFGVSVERIPYGTPMRVKVSSISMSDTLLGLIHRAGVPYQRSISELSIQNLAVWLETSDPDATLPAEVHPWSRITYIADRTETRRITEEQAAEIHALRDLFKLADPNVTDAQLAKVDTIPASVQHTGPRADVSVDSVTVRGCILFKHGATMHIEKPREPGITGLIGDNGDGKSSTLAFFTPYPVIFGKDTDSGRASAIKDFFDQPESMIEKSLTIDGVPHHHLITIRGAHTKSPKVECYLEINGIPQLDKGSFDEMQEKCEELYGSMAEYSVTTFYEQPQQSKSNNSGLMSAGKTDIRNIVNNIAGVDRTAEKEYALVQRATIDGEITSKNGWLEGARTFVGDEDEISGEILALKSSIEKTRSDMADSEHLGKELRVAADEAEKYRDKHAEIKREIDRIDGELRQIVDDRMDLNVRIKDAQRAASGREHAEYVIAEHERMTARLAELQEAYNSAITEHQKIKDAWQAETDRIRERNAEYDRIQQRIDTIDQLIGGERHDTCPHCLNVLPWAESEAKRAEELELEKVKLVDTIDGMARVPMPSEPPAMAWDDTERQQIKRRLMSDDVESAKRAITLADSAQQHIDMTQFDIKKLDERNTELTARINGLSASHDLEATSKYTHAMRALDTARTEYTELKSHLASIETQLAAEQKKLKETRETKQQITDTEQQIATLTDDRSDWDYIARMLQPSKIPALELDLVLDAIDAEATRIIEPFQEGRYSFTTRTQRQGQRGTVDDFDLMIHNNETGREKSFLKFSPGEKAFFNDAYTKALVRKRNERAKRRYDPVIMDEADAPVQPERIEAFYEMQNAYWTDSTVFVVSHNAISHQYMTRTIAARSLQE